MTPDKNSTPTRAESALSLTFALTAAKIAGRIIRDAKYPQHTKAQMQEILGLLEMRIGAMVAMLRVPGPDATAEEISLALHAHAVGAVHEVLGYPAGDDDKELRN